MDKNADQQIKRDHERLLRDVPTPQLVQHLAGRCDHMVLAYMPKIDGENIYTYQLGHVAERDEMARALVHDAVDAGLPPQRKQE